MELINIKLNQILSTNGGHHDHRNHHVLHHSHPGKRHRIHRDHSRNLRKAELLLEALQTLAVEQLLPLEVRLQPVVEWDTRIDHSRMGLDKLVHIRSDKPDWGRYCTHLDNLDLDNSDHTRCRLGTADCNHCRLDKPGQGRKLVRN